MSERYTKLIKYHLETKLQTELSDEMVHDIRTNVEAAVKEAVYWEGEWKKHYDELKKKNFPFKWNELRIKLARMKTEEMDEVLDLMHMLDDGISIR